jgi:pimeloyl-ACP methyl ester carboxylesterase
MARFLTAPYAAMLVASCTPRYAHLPPISPADLWSPLPVQSVEVDGIRVAYVDSGTPSGEPPIVFIHGLSSYLGYWEYQIPEFAKGRRVLALDLPGFGQSARPDAPYTPPWYADLVVSWLDEVGVTRADVVGHSMGGQIALTIALQRPERVRRLVLSAPAGIETFRPGAQAWMKEYWTESRALEASESELRATFENAVFNHKDDGVERLLRERVLLRQTPAFRGTSVAVSRCIAGMLDHPVADRLGEIRAPTLLVYGTDDRMIPNPVFNGGSTRSVAQKGRDAIAGSRLVLIPGAGHTVHHDAPDIFNDAVSKFLRETP